MILGIDPSLNGTGWCVLKRTLQRSKFEIVDKGVILFKVGGDYMAKLSSISSSIGNIFMKYPQIECMAIEETIVNKNPSSSLKLGMVRGVCIGVALSHNVKISEYKPNLIKSSIAGNGHATKEQVAFFVKNMIQSPIQFETHDVSDSIGVAITHALLAS